MNITQLVYYRPPGIPIGFPGARSFWPANSSGWHQRGAAAGRAAGGRAQRGAWRGGQRAAWRTRGAEPGG